MRWVKTPESHDAGTQTFKGSSPTAGAKWSRRHPQSPGKRNEKEWLRQRRNKGLETLSHEWRYNASERNYVK